jgi:hypothetical protein
MKKYVKVCDCPPTGNYNSFVAGKFRQVETKNDICIHCGHMAMDMKMSDLENKKKVMVIHKEDEVQDQTLELGQNEIDRLDIGGNHVHIDEFSEGIY